MLNNVDIFKDFNLGSANINNLKKYLKLLKNPHTKLKVIKIVGTNGKGSTANYLSHLLKNNGFKVGLFTSPSFEFHNERIQTNHEQISDFDLKRVLQKIKLVVNENQINFFELFFLTAVIYFAQQNCDYCVFEAGIGGMLDSTSLLVNSIATILTSVSLDHTEILGNKIEEIIYQKIKIAKPNETVFVVYSNKQYKNVILKYHSNCVFVDKLNLNDNLFINEAACNVVSIAKHFNWKVCVDWNQNKVYGRMSLIKNNIILDGAHNLDAIKKLCLQIKKQFLNKNVWVVYSAIKTKDYLNCIKHLNQEFNNQVVLCSFNHIQTINKSDVDLNNEWIDFDQILTFVEKNDKEDNLILFCGSIYFISQVDYLFKKINYLKWFV